MKIVHGICAAAGLFSALAAGGAAQASYMNFESVYNGAYEGTLTLEESVDHKLYHGTGANKRVSQWWGFELEAGDQVVITVHRLENAFDAAFRLYFGYDSELLPIAFANDEIDQLDGYAGSGKDAQYVLTAEYSGMYSVEVFNMLNNAGGGDKAFDYRISFTTYSPQTPGADPFPDLGASPVRQPVSEPATVGLMGAGLFGFGAFRRLRRKG